MVKPISQMTREEAVDKVKSIYQAIAADSNLPKLDRAGAAEMIEDEIIDSLSEAKVKRLLRSLNKSIYRDK